MNMLYEISKNIWLEDDYVIWDFKIVWLEEGYVIWDFKNYLIRRWLCFLRFQIIWLEEEYIIWDFKN